MSVSLRPAFFERTASRASRRIPEDRAFQEAFARRCPSAWTLLFPALTSIFRKHIRRVLPGGMDQAEVLSQTWYRAYKYAHKYDPARPLVPWLLTVCHHACIREYERHCRREERSAAVAAPERGAWDQHPPEASSSLAQFLTRLPERDQEVLVLRVLHGLATSVVAEVLGVSEEVVRQRFARALDRAQGCRWPASPQRNGADRRSHER